MLCIPESRYDHSSSRIPRPFSEFEHKLSVLWPLSDTIRNCHYVETNFNKAIRAHADFCHRFTSVPGCQCACMSVPVYLSVKDFILSSQVVANICLLVYLCIPWTDSNKCECLCAIWHLLKDLRLAWLPLDGSSCGDGGLTSHVSYVWQHS